MIVSLETAQNVFRKVQQVRDEYRQTVLRGDVNVVSVEDLQWVIGRMYAITIEKRLVPFEGQFIQGMIERREGSALITVRHGLGGEVTRFVTVKELCHIMNDEKEDWSPDGVGTLEELLSEIVVQRQDMAQRVAQSEAFAEIAAMELLYPYELRQGDMKKLAVGETTQQIIATYHGVPVSMVSRALAKNHHDLATKIWTHLNNSEAA